MKNITIVYNKFDIVSVIAAAFMYSYYKSLTVQFKHKVKAISNDSSEEFLVTEDPNYIYIFIGISEVGKRFLKTNHKLIFKNDEGNVLSQVYHSVKQDKNEYSMLYKKLNIALDNFLTKDLNEAEAALCLKHYLLSLDVLKDEADFIFLYDGEINKEEFKSFIKELKNKFKTNFTGNNPFTQSKGILFPVATVSDMYAVWVSRFMKLSYSHYINIVVTGKGMIIDSDVPGIKEKIFDEPGYVMAYQYL